MDCDFYSVFVYRFFCGNWKYGKGEDDCVDTNNIKIQVQQIEYFEVRVKYNSF